MWTRVSAIAALTMGVWAAIAVLTVLGAGLGALLGVPALICGVVALTERPAGLTRRAAVAGVVTGAIGIAGFLIWVLLAVLGV
jgi:hypothetical protein